MIVKTDDNKELKLPDFLIVGTARGGTTSLFYYLDQHPGIYFPSQKEPFFFNYMGQSTEKIGDPDFQDAIVSRVPDYLTLFEKAGDHQIFGEGSTTYLYDHKTVIPNIKKLYGSGYKDLKIVAVLRNPTQRAFSHYMYFIRRNKENLSFSEALQPEIIKQRLKLNLTYDYFGFGLYYEQIKAYKEAFPLFNVCFIEDMKTDTEAFMNDMFAFLGLDPVAVDTDFVANPSGYPKNLFSKLFLKIYSRSKLLRHVAGTLFPKGIKHRVLGKLLKKGTLDPAIRDSLIDAFTDDIVRLGELLGRDLGHWLKK